MTTREFEQPKLETPAEILRSIQELGTKSGEIWRILQETAALQKAADRRIAETDRQMAETDRRRAETDRQMAETDRRMEETDRLMKETARQMAESDRRMDRLDRRFSSQWGSLMGSRSEGALSRLLRDRGVNVQTVMTN